MEHCLECIKNEAQGEKIDTEEKKENNKRVNTENRFTNIPVVGGLSGLGVTESTAEAVLEEILAQNLPKCMKYIKPQI